MYLVARPGSWRRGSVVLVGVDLVALLEPLVHPGRGDRHHLQQPDPTVAGVDVGLPAALLPGGGLEQVERDLDVRRRTGPVGAARRVGQRRLHLGPARLGALVGRLAGTRRRLRGRRRTFGLGGRLRHRARFRVGFFVGSASGSRYDSARRPSTPRSPTGSVSLDLGPSPSAPSATATGAATSWGSPPWRRSRRALRQQEPGEHRGAQPIGPSNHAVASPVFVAAP